MAHLRDIKVGMKVEIVKGIENCDFFTTGNIGSSGTVKIVDHNDSMRSVFVEFSKRPSEWYPPSWIKIIKDEGETKMTTAQPQKYVLMDEEDISKPFTDISSKGILGTSYEEWCWYITDTTERIKEGKMKLFKIEEVKLEVTEPSIKIVG